MLHAAGDDAKRAIDDPDVRINSHRDREVRLALAEVSVEKKSIVKVAVAGEYLLNRLWRLMNRIIVTLCNHGLAPNPDFWIIVEIARSCRSLRMWREPDVLEARRTHRVDYV